jgi:acetolactate synthase-1/2/3 large subunit
VDKNAFQEIDHVRLFDAVAKFVRRVDRADRIEDYVDMAFTAATSGRPGPAVLLVPADLLAERAGRASPRRASLGRYPLDRTVADPARIAEAAALLAAARRPLVIAGGGIHLSDAAPELAALQQDAHLPVATTFMGKGAVAETHPLSLGVVGNTMGVGARTREMRAMVEGADVVLLVGNRTNQNGTDSWHLYPRGARFIHIDPDGLEIGRNYEAVRLLGDAKLTLAALRAEMVKLDLAARLAARPDAEAQIAAAVAAWRTLVAGVTTRDGGPVRPERVVAELDRRLPAGAIACADASYSSNWITNYLTAKRAGRRFLTPRGLAGLGWGVPLAIGAQVAAPQARVVALCGDGGFGHSWAELETLRRLNLPVTVIVLNNGILGFQKHGEDTILGEHTIACDFAEVDHAAIARACGIRAARVERGEDLGPALDAAFAANAPNLIEVLTDPDAKPPLTFFDGHYPEPF